MPPVSRWKNGFWLTVCVRGSVDISNAEMTNPIAVPAKRSLNAMNDNSAAARTGLTTLSRSAQADARQRLVYRPFGEQVVDHRLSVGVNAADVT